MPTGLSSGVGGGGITAQGLPAGMTVGTVKLVDGQKLYVTDASGATVIVTVPATATVTSQAEIPLSGLSAGDSVVVRGEAAADGSVTATSVAEGALPGGPAGGPATSTTTPTSPTSASTAPSTQGEN
jgi:hypothetical protein